MNRYVFYLVCIEYVFKTKMCQYILNTKMWLNTFLNIYHNASYMPIMFTKETYWHVLLQYMPIHTIHASMSCHVFSWYLLCTKNDMCKCIPHIYYKTYYNTSLYIHKYNPNTVQYNQYIEYTLKYRPLQAQIQTNNMVYNTCTDTRQYRHGCCQINPSLTSSTASTSCTDVRGSHWSGSRVQVWVQVWAPAGHWGHLAICQKAILEGNRKLEGEINGKHLGPLFGSACPCRMGEHKHRAFPHWQQSLRAATGSLEENILPLLQYWLSKSQFKRQQGFNAL